MSKARVQGDTVVASVALRHNGATARKRRSNHGIERFIIGRWFHVIIGPRSMGCRWLFVLPTKSKVGHVFLRIQLVHPVHRRMHHETLPFDRSAGAYSSCSSSLLPCEVVQETARGPKVVVSASSSSTATTSFARSAAVFGARLLRCDRIPHAQPSLK
jgi:hypothetical protein